MAQAKGLDARVGVAAAERPARVSAVAQAAAPLLLAAVAAIGYAAAAIYRHDRFGSTAYDLGIFDQSIWGYSRFELIHNTVRRLPTLGDHFHPILMSLAPLYWIWDDVRVLLIAQAVLLSAASLPIFLWARERLGWPAALAFQSAYLSFWAVLAGNLADFHEVAVAAPIVSVALYALVTRRTRLLLATTLLAFLTKENLALTFAAIGLYAAVVQRFWRLGVALCAASVAWFAAVYALVLPAIAGRSYVQWVYPALGSGPRSALVHLVAHPLDSVKLFFTPSSKWTALFNTFAPWLFLPLASPLLLVLLPGLAERFLSTKPALWAQGFHYGIVTAPILAFAAIDTAARIRDLAGARATTWLAAAVLAAGLGFTFLRIQPLDQLERYTPGEQADAIESCLATVGADESVTATSALVPHLTHRRRIYVLDRRPVPATDVVAIDTSTWIFPLTTSHVAQIVRRSFGRGYGVRCSRRYAAVLARDSSSRRLSPELSAQLPLG